MGFETIEQAISEATGATFRVAQSRPVGGGCINEAWCLEGGGERYFVKLNSVGKLSMFEAEAAGLAQMAETGAIRVPRPVASGADEQHSWLVLEYIDMGTASEQTSEALGEQLAAMHRHTTGQFGWDRDNTIGATPQANAWQKDWIHFYGSQRLGFQLRLARDNGAAEAMIDRGEQLLEMLPAFFDGYTPLPALLHGDLWGGNWAADSQGDPVLFDPAVYYGDREADLAMTELFGGFSDRFYHSYRSSWDIDPGYATRKVLYNLYHVLNHFNLFGGSYAGQARDMIDRLIAEAH